MRVFASSGDTVYIEVYKENGIAIWLDQNGVERVWHYVEEGGTSKYIGLLHEVLYFQELRYGYFDNAKIIVSQDLTPAIDCLLLEDTDYILLEDGGRILLE